ncbi:serine protein kinase RIO [Aestuariimicrobium kwangyangense]|uniref:serine protein kinase RIO n=1 Tax=Aestuariimicrobium kwangyangense TaxID=396389 RepID=UPI0003B3E992|nr:RIO1 family regulatory kinase/ATPase [Aestuariimicrobium kwangyangense]
MNPSSFDWSTVDLTFGATELDENQRWSTWPDIGVTQGPPPQPAWVVQHEAARDTELGVLKTGKEADAHLIERALVPAERTGAVGEWSMLVAKRYRSHDHRSFGGFDTYLAGVRTRNTREGRAKRKGTDLGREVAVVEWARREFDLLSTFWSAGLPVPYPVQVTGTELLMEFIGDAPAQQAAPRLVQTSPDPAELADLAGQARRVVVRLAELGWVHGDLSPYNTLVHEGRLVVIDVPQAVELVVHPQAHEWLLRDCTNLCDWFTRRGHTEDPQEWFAEAVSSAW